MESEVEDWLRGFARAVRARDYAAAAALFDPGVVAFGTVAERADGIDALIARQWRVVWEATRDFDFDYATLRCERHGARAWVAASWSSHALAQPAPEARRTGRASLVLAHGERGWRALHSHFSLTPGEVR